MRKCDECGREYPITELVKCKLCGKILCQNCRATHKCVKPSEDDTVFVPDKSPKKKIKLPKWALITIIVLGVLILGAAGFLLYLNYAPIDVTIDTVPQGAQIYIDGENAGISPLKAGVSPKVTHTISTDLNGYNPWYGEITPKRFAENEVTAYLEPLVPTLSITSSPDGAAVYLNEKYIGTTPLKNYETTVGTHTIRLSMDNYSDWYDTVTVTLGERAEIAAELENGTEDNGSKEPGTLKLTSEPAGATVSIDGEVIGVTPIDVSVTPRKTHTVLFENQGYYTYKTMAVVGAGKTKTVDAQLSTMPGWLTVQSVPGNADVYIDGQYVGFTALSSYEVSTGVTHTIRLEKENYETWTQTVSLDKGEKKEIIATLELKPSILKITSEPSGAKVYLGNDITEEGSADSGVISGTTPFEITVRPGLATTIRVEKDGYYPWPDLRYYDYPVSTDSGWTAPNSKTGTNYDVFGSNNYAYQTYYVSVGIAKTKELHAVLKEIPAILNIVTDPAGVQVYIDDVFKGKTPIENLEITGNAMHTISLQMDGYHTKYFTISVEGGKSQLISETLTPNA